MTAFYNEIEPYTAQWLKNLMEAGEIAPGVVDERSIEDVTSGELLQYERCHFFAGIGGWDYALRLAGWPADVPVWTGSCPCQPFSSAGKRGGGADERHLWPAWYWLIRECCPPIIFGEQVASKDGLRWLDVVFADLEAAGYYCGAADLCAAGVGAPHIRQRLWFVASLGKDSSRIGRRGRGYGNQAGEQGALQVKGLSPTGILAHTSGPRPRNNNRPAPDEGGFALQPGGEGIRQAHGEVVPNRVDSASPACELADTEENRCGRESQRAKEVSGIEGLCPACELADAELCGCKRIQKQPSTVILGEVDVSPCSFESVGAHRPGSDNPWYSPLWLPCRDGRYRPTAAQYGPVIAPLQPLVDGSAFRVGSGSPLEGKNRVGMLRAAGNCIVPPLAAIFIKSIMEILNVD